MKHRYHANPEPKNRIYRYKANAETLRATQQKWHKPYSMSILFNRRCAYYASALHRRTSKLVQDVLQSANKKTGVRHARYSLKEPKHDVQELHVKNMRQTVACNHILKRELTEAFKTSHKALAIASSNQVPCLMLLHLLLSVEY